MYCPKCGNKVGDNVKFCVHCGFPASSENHQKTVSNSFLKILLKVVIFIAVWFVSIIAALLLFVPESGEITSLFTLFLILILPVALAVLAILPWQKIISKPNTKPTTNGPINYQAAVVKAPPTCHTAAHPTQSTSLKQHISTPNAQSSSPENRNADETAAAIVAALREQTIQELTPSGEPEIKQHSASGAMKKTYHVTGVQHYVSNLLNLAFDNNDYNMSKREIVDSFMTDERIYQHCFYPSKVELLPEPENPYDPNAIKVIVDNEHVGYIKKGSCKHLLKVISEDRIGGIDCDIGGGNYKYVYENEEEYGKYELDKNSSNYFVTLHIREIEI